jgi:hypothetical protein
MGWSSGSSYMEQIVTGLLAEERTKDDADLRLVTYRLVYDIFEDMDWDTHDEVFGLDPALDYLLREKGFKVPTSNDDDDTE